MASRSKRKREQVVHPGDVQLPFFETQHKHRCGIHALNNIFRNFKSSHRNRVMFVHGGKGCALNPANTNIDIQAICKEHQEHLAQAYKQSKKKAAIGNACPDSGEYQSDVMRKAIQRAGSIDITDYSYVTGRQEFRQSVDERKAMYETLVARAKAKNFMGFLVNNTVQGGHYVAIVKYKNKLVWVDSLDSSPKSLDKDRFLQEGKKILEIWEIQDSDQGLTESEGSGSKSK